MAAPTFVAAGTSSAGTGTLAPTLPTGWAQNDILLYVVQSSAQTIATPSGYTALGDQTRTSIGAAATAGSVRLAIFWKRAGSSETAPTIANPGNHGIAQIYAFRGCATSGNPWDFQTEGYSNNPGAASWNAMITVWVNGVSGYVTCSTANSDERIVCIVAHSVDSNTAPLAGWFGTNVTSFAEGTGADVSTNSGTGGGFGMASGTVATAGTAILRTSPTADVGWTSISGAIMVMAVIALKGPNTPVRTTTETPTTSEAGDPTGQFIRYALGSTYNLAAETGDLLVAEDGISHLLGDYGEVLATAESATAVKPPILRTTSETVSTSESVNTIQTKARSATDTPATAESVGRTGLFIRYGGTSGTSPDSLSGLDAWWKADSLAQADGSTVLSWSDSSGGGNTATASGSPPIFKTNVLNGKPVIRFDGTNGQYLRSPDLGISQPNMVLLVFKQTSKTNICSFYDHNYTAGGARQFFRLNENPGGQVQMYAGSAVATATNDFSGAFHVFSVEFNGASSAAYVDGVLEFSPTTIGTGGQSAVEIGGDGSNFFTYPIGDLAEIIVYNRLLTGTERQGVELYLRQKYGFVAQGELIATSESVAGSKLFIRSSTEAPATTESIARVLAAKRTTADTPTTAESVIRTLFFLRAVSEALSTLESATGVRQGGAALTRTAAEALATAESIVRIVSLLRSTTENVSISESLARSTNLARITAENVAASMAIARIVALVRAGAETVNTSETAAGIKIFARSVTETLATVEALSRILNTQRNGTEAVSTSETMSRSMSKARSTSEALSAAMTVARIVQLLRTAADNPTTAELASRTVIQHGKAAEALEVLGVQELVTRIFQGSRNGADAPHSAESAIKSVQFIRSSTEALLISELLSRRVNLTRSSSEELLIAELIARTFSGNRFVAEALSIAEIANKIRGTSVYTTETLSTEELVIFLWISGFAYLLDLQAGNAPTISTASALQTKSELGNTESITGDQLLGWETRSGLMDTGSITGDQLVGSQTYR